MVLFGKRSEFGVEVLVDDEMGLSSEWSQLFSGRCCVWFEEVPIGDLDQRGCPLDLFRGELQQAADGLAELWHPRLAGLTGEQRFDLIDRYMFFAHRTRSLAEGLTVEATQELFARLDRERDGLRLPSLFGGLDEAFDAWKTFLVVPPPGYLVQALWVGPDDERAIVHEAAVPCATFRRVVGEFAAWFPTAQAVWRTRHPRG